MSLRYEGLQDLPPGIRAQAEAKMAKRDRGAARQNLAAAVLPQLSESQEQQAVMVWAEINTWRWPILARLYHIPNGGGRSKAQAGLLKAEGVKSGVPDLCLPVARGGYHGLYIEMKSMTGVPSAPQKEWIAALLAEGYLAVVCKGAAAAVLVLTDYLQDKLRRGKAEAGEEGTDAERI